MRENYPGQVHPALLRAEGWCRIVREVFACCLVGYVLWGFLMWGSSTSANPGFSGEAGLSFGLPSGPFIWIFQRSLRSLIGR